MNANKRMDFRLTKIFLFLTILLAPLYVVRFRVGMYPSTLLEVLVGLTVGAWVVEKKGLKGLKGINAPTALFLVAAAVSVFFSPDKLGALGIFKAYFVEPILIFLIIKDIIKSKEDWWWLFAALVFSGLWIALLAVFQGLTGLFTFAPHEAALGRAHAVYNSANAVGLYIGPVIVLLLGSVRGLKGVKGIKGIMVGGVGLMILAVLLSQSAGAMVGLVGGLGALGVLRIRREMRVIGGVGVIGIILGALFFFNISSFAPKNVDPYVRKSNDTLSFRLCLWEGARNLLLDRPIFGAGLSGFKELYSQKYFTCDAEPLEYPHNWVLNFWAETGILGLLGFLGILGVYFKNIKCQMSNVKYRRLALGFFAAMIYWLVHGLVDVPYFKNDLSLEFWAIVGLLETLQVRLFEEPRSESGC